MVFENYNPTLGLKHWGWFMAPDIRVQYEPPFRALDHW